MSTGPERTGLNGATIHCNSRCLSPVSGSYFSQSLVIAKRSRETPRRATLVSSRSRSGSRRWALKFKNNGTFRIRLYLRPPSSPLANSITIRNT